MPVVVKEGGSRGDLPGSWRSIEAGEGATPVDEFAALVRGIWMRRQRGPAGAHQRREMLKPEVGDTGRDGWWCDEVRPARTDR